jgi:hypothetical protein
LNRRNKVGEVFWKNFLAITLNVTNGAIHNGRNMLKTLDEMFFVKTHYNSKIIMVLITVFLLIFFSAGTLVGGDAYENAYKVVPKDWGQPSNGFRLAIVLKKTILKTNDYVMIAFVLKNFDGKPHWLMDSGSLDDYTFALENDQGKVFTRRSSTNIFQSYLDSAASWNPGIGKLDLQLGEQRIVESDLKLVFDLNKPGKYKLTASRLVPVLPLAIDTNVPVNFTNVISNVAEFSIGSETK